MAHKLVLAGVGGRTVNELNDTMTVSEFVRWQAYEKLFPWGLEDLNAARLLHLLASIYSKKGHEPKLKNFLIGEIPENEPDPEELEAKFEALAQLTGAYETPED